MGTPLFTSPFGGKNVKTRPLIGIVDDDAAVRIALTRLCESNKLRTQAFASAQQLFDFIQDGTIPDCLVVDVQMPDIGGIIVQKWLLRCGLSIPVIMITGHVDERTRVHSLALGARNFLYKPMCPHALLHTIKDALFAAPNVQWPAFVREARLASQT